MKTGRPIARQIHRLSLTLALLIAMLLTLLPSPTSAQSKQYVVHPGDTLSEIAWYNGVSVQALMQINKIRNPNHIYVGQTLVIPVSGGTGGGHCSAYHTVRPGETLSGIALRYGVSAYDLAQANGILNLNHIYYGQKLCVPYGQPMQPAPMPKPEPYMQQPAQPMYGQQAMQQPAMQNPAMQQQPMYPEQKGPQMQQMSAQQQMQPKPQQPAMQQQAPQQPQQPMKPKQDGPKQPAKQHPPQPKKQETKWHGAYYEGKYFEKLIVERKDSIIDFDWGLGSPASGVPKDRFSVSWTSEKHFKQGRYRFETVSDDGVRVYLDGELIIDAWNIQPATTNAAYRDVSGGFHTLRVEYFEEAEDASIKFGWWQVKPR